MPDTLTYYTIATQTLANNTTSTVTFSSIPSTYKHLMLIITARSTRAITGDSSFYVQFNQDTNNTTSYSNQWLRNSTTVPTAGIYGPAFVSAASIGYLPGDNNAAGVAATMKMEIPFYSTTSYRKTNLTQKHMNTAVNTGYSDKSTNFITGHWNPVATINRIDIVENGFFFVSGSTFTLWGIN